MLCSAGDGKAVTGPEVGRDLVRAMMLRATQSILTAPPRLNLFDNHLTEDSWPTMLQFPKLTE